MNNPSHAKKIVQQEMISIQTFEFTKWDEETTKSDLLRFNGPSVKRKAVVMDSDGKYMNKEAGPGKRRVLCQPNAPPPSKSTHAIPTHFMSLWGKRHFYANNRSYFFKTKSGEH